MAVAKSFVAIAALATLAACSPKSEPAAPPKPAPTAAGKLAEGKFMYSVVMSDDALKFPLGKATLSPEAESRLSAFAERLKGENKNVYVEVQGHTDATGSPEGNMRLAQERAETVRRYLNKQGVALNRMATISYGEDEPVAANNTRDGRMANRRVVLVVLS